MSIVVYCCKILNSFQEYYAFEVTLYKHRNVPTKVLEQQQQLSLYRSIHKVKSMTNWRKEFCGCRLAVARRHDTTVNQSTSYSRYSRFLSYSAIRRVKQHSSAKQNTTREATRDFVEQMLLLSRETINYTASVSGCQNFT